MNSRKSCHLNWCFFSCAFIRIVCFAFIFSYFQNIFGSRLIQMQFETFTPESCPIWSACLWGCDVIHPLQLPRLSQQGVKPRALGYNQSLSFTATPACIRGQRGKCHTAPSDCYTIKAQKYDGGLGGKEQWWTGDRVTGGQGSPMHIGSENWPVWSNPTDELCWSDWRRS